MDCYTTKLIQCSVLYFIVLNQPGQQWDFCMNDIGLFRYEGSLKVIGSSKVIFLRNIIFLNIFSLLVIQVSFPDTHILIFLLMYPMDPSHLMLCYNTE